ncbi:cadherin-like beta sandwich domain-containing protein [Clostridium sp. C2-6-12]|uniref:N-acetylmuramoyl-L-alanine amidase family protein n=1 Tax=Clostridium sp. C2-6-12 TaxID=2698832 RepID=UPI00136DB748|nr:cadherin-like beta sandwich domain-containing protein [Clostridium sp. C2-6-12]
MNKNIKRIIVAGLITNAITTFSPMANFMETKAYASVSDAQLKSIYLSDGNIDFSSSTYSYTVKVSSSVDEIRISARPKDSDATVEIDGTKVDRNDSYKNLVSLNRGKNTIKIKVTDDNDDYTKTYTLYIYRGSADDKLDNIYLRTLSISDGDIDFDKNKTSYSTSVTSSIDRVTIKAKPEDSTSRVRINGGTVKDEDDYKKTINLSMGENQIEIDVQDHEEIRTYKLNINRGGITDGQEPVYLERLRVDGSNVSLSRDKTKYDMEVNQNVNEVKITAEPEDRNYIVTINGTEIDRYDDFEKRFSLNTGKNEFKIKVKDETNNDERNYVLNVTRGIKTSNQWLEVNGKYEYLDASGNPLKNSWFLDKGVGKYYYLDGEGYRSIGWLNNNGKWYFLDSTGIMQTGWQFINESCYYLGDDGAMRTGWILNENKYYHLNNNGAMDRNTIIEGYRLGSDGAWIK